MNVVTIIGSDGPCAICGKVAELRPYGPNGESVCFDCGMKDEAAALAQFRKLIAGADVVVVGMHENDNPQQP